MTHSQQMGPKNAKKASRRRSDARSAVCQLLALTWARGALVTRLPSADKDRYCNNEEVTNEQRSMKCIWNKTIDTNGQTVHASFETE